MIQKRPALINLFLEFLRLGATAFGGPSMVVYIRKLAVERKIWLDGREFSEGLAFCQMIPGATAMQTAAYVGLRVRGISGAAASFIGFGLPAFCLMLVFAVIYAQTGTLPAVVAIFTGLQAIVVAIIANATLTFGKTTLKNWKHAVIAGIAAFLFWVNVHPLIVIILAGGAGALILPIPDTLEQSKGRSSVVKFQKKTYLTILLVLGIGLVSLYVFSKDLFNLSFLMLRVDLMAFGGGFASVPIMYNEVVEVNNWLNGPTFMNGIILGQITPGPVVITATFIGYLLSGLLGAVIATICIFSPSFLLVAGLYPFYNRFSASPQFNKIIQGILCSFVGLLLSVTIRFAFQVHWDVFHVLLSAAALLALVRRIDILWVVLVGTILIIWFIK